MPRGGQGRLRGVHPRGSPEDIDVGVRSWGPTPEQVTAGGRAFLQQPDVRRLLKGARTRLLAVDLMEPIPERKPVRPLQPSKQVRATLYDYTNNKAIHLDGRLGDPRRVTITEWAQQPRPSEEEFAAAVQILRQEPAFGDALRAQRLRPYAPMPPLIMTEQPDGRIERTIAVGVLPERKGLRHEIVGVNMIRRTVSRFDDGAPPAAAAHNPICGLPNAGQATTSSAPGQVWVTVSQGGTVLWRFLAVRPTASSGTNGSGVELRYVDYRGKRVLYRAHVPILNVKYDPGGCGPYRDWQDQEGMLQANGADVASGFRLCPMPAQTILNTGSDVGNFLGVAIYAQGLEAVLVSEMQAGWYRYVSEWRLHADGTIRPRFGFSAVESSCVCTRHHHHAYWRLDFDIRTAGHNRVREFNDPPLFTDHWHTKSFEIRRPRDPSRNRKWRVMHTGTGDAYDVIPGPDDGTATASPDWPFPRGDVWILRYHGTELDDGVVATGPPYEAGLDSFVNGEAIADHDVVMWYGAHVTHDIALEPPGTHGHIVGPTLKPVSW